MDAVEAASRNGSADPREDRRLDLHQSAGQQGLEADRRCRLPRLDIGGAMVSEMHCNFLINTGAATAHDLSLGETVRARVLETSGVRLEWRFDAWEVRGG